MSDGDQQDEQAYAPQHPCPACGEPMGGLGWRVSPHECTNPMACPHSEHWLGAWGDCHRGCPTEQVANAARAEGERAATERIVTWLRRPLVGTEEFIEDNRRDRFDHADAIERGEHNG